MCVTFALWYARLPQSLCPHPLLMETIHAVQQLYLPRHTFCRGRHTNPLSPSVQQNIVLDFFTVLHQCNLGYNTIKTVRSALSTFIMYRGKPVGFHPLVTRVRKGVFALRPALPRSEVTWGVQRVLEYLRTLWSIANLFVRDYKAHFTEYNTPIVCFNIFFWNCLLT